MDLDHIISFDENPFDQINPFDQTNQLSAYHKFSEMINLIKDKQLLIGINQLLENRLRELK